jgi:hypothetical protein
LRLRRLLDPQPATSGRIPAALAEHMMQRHRIPRWIAYGALCAIALGTCKYVLGGGFFQWTSFCSISGAERQSTRLLWIIPWHKTFATQLSAFATREGLVGAHPHDWLFAAGGGSGVRCAIGQGRHLIGVVRDDQYCSFLRALRDYRGVDGATAWLHRGLDPAQSIDVVSTFRATGSEFGDRDSFDRWFDQQTEVWKLFHPEDHQ